MSEEAKDLYQMIHELYNDDVLFSERDEFEMMKYVEKGAIFISTPFSRKAVDR